MSSPELSYRITVDGRLCLPIREALRQPVFGRFLLNAKASDG